MPIGLLANRHRAFKQSFRLSQSEQNLNARTHSRHTQSGSSIFQVWRTCWWYIVA